MEQVKVRTDKLTYERAIAGDVAWLTDTYIASLGEAIAKARGTWSEERERALFLTQLRLDDTTIVCRGTERIGFYTAWSEPDHLFIPTLCISPQYQGQGYGATIIQSLAGRARELPVKLVALKSSPRARQFYERLGYQWVGEDQYYDVFRSPSVRRR